MIVPKRDSVGPAGRDGREGPTGSANEARRFFTWMADS